MDSSAWWPPSDLGSHFKLFRVSDTTLSTVSGAGASSLVPGEHLGPRFRDDLLMTFIISLPLKSLPFWAVFFLSEILHS